MEKSKIIKSLAYLGQHIGNIPDQVITQASFSNSWFTPASIQLAAANWADALSIENIHTWLDQEAYAGTPKKVGIIMAGNIPFVGLHDLLSVLAKGHIANIKLSGQDEILMKYVIELLYQSEPALVDRIIISDNMKTIDFLIATGSNNSARYFEYYFRNIPSLIRKNRTSAAVVTGNETDEELTAIADDIYTYFGLGCRNVTHLLLPRDIELKRLYDAYDKYIDIVHHNKYYNNYMYHKSILLMNLSKHYDNGFMLFQEKDGPHAPIATLNYHYYDSLDEANAYLDTHRDLWQCIVSISPEVPHALKPGTTQKTMLWDYADNVNTLRFLEPVA